MKIISKAKLFQKTLEGERRKGHSIGFIPTMGALHAGHLALVRAAKKQNSITAVSLFVNPTQFGPHEDFKKYPRDLKRDAALLRRAGVDYLFCPAVDEIYPKGEVFQVRVSDSSFLTQSLCGRFRPGHFDGVAMVVAKLFALTGACRAYFGAKDYQQTVVIKKLVRDMFFSIQVIVCPTVRDKDGMALSSRNQYLSPGERKQAVKISQVLFALKRSWSRAKRLPFSLELVKKQAVRNLEQAGLRVQYFEAVDPETLAPLRESQSKILVATACFAGKTRLIDNVILCVPRGETRVQKKTREK